MTVHDNTNWDLVKSDRDRPLNTGRQLYTVPLTRGSNVYLLRWFSHHNYIVELPLGVFNNNINLTQL